MINKDERDKCEDIDEYNACGTSCQTHHQLHNACGTVSCSSWYIDGGTAGNVEDSSERSDEYMLHCLVVGCTWSGSSRDSDEGKILGEGILKVKRREISWVWDDRVSF